MTIEALLVTSLLSWGTVKAAPATFDAWKEARLSHKLEKFCKEQKECEPYKEYLRIKIKQLEKVPTNGTTN